MSSCANRRQPTPSKRDHSRRNRRQPRRGVLLLVCLVVLIFFLLSGLTFVLVATQWRQGAESHAQAGHNYDLYWQDDIHNIAMGFIRGDQNRMSPFRFNNLLEDMYGGDSISGTIADTVLPRASGQFLVFKVNPSGGQTFDQTHGYYNGQVLSVLTGVGAVESFRIVNYYNNSGVGEFVVAPTDSDGNYAGNVRQPPVTGDVVHINGRPFNGTGLGYDPSNSDPTLIGTVTSTQGALEPNLVYSNFNSSPILGGLDEDYDAWDHNNPWLAAVPPSGLVKPSWHDMTLIKSQTNDLTSSANASYVFRPLGNEDNSPQNHPNFDGSNPNFTYLDGPWDIDNDGDGQPDSIWIDPGLPVRRTADGRLFRPLVAMLVVDLDGKVNVNAAGNITHSLTDLNSQAGELAGAASAITLPRGVGYGPADIDLSAVGAGSVLTGDASYDGRYGADGQPGDVDDSSTLTNEGDDTLSMLLQAMQYGGGKGFGPLDISGSMAVAVDRFGRPSVFDLFDSGDSIELILENDPYEQILDPRRAATLNSGNKPIDEPFKIEELEAVYRDWDSDAGELPPRLLSLAGGAGQGAGSAITTESWNLPVASFMPRTASDRVGHENASLADLIRAKSGTMTSATLNEQMTGTRTDADPPESTKRSRENDRFLSLDLLAGLRMDLNRLFGNGRDEDSLNGVDDVGETSDKVFPGGLTVKLPGGTANFTSQSTFDFLNDGTVAGNSIKARQRYAKQLYIMLMLLAKDQAYTGMFSETRTADEYQALLAQRLAQFAINAVDFRDHDATMTGFEYDPNPFDGWDVDDDLNTTDDGPRVWGSEAPAMLLTEAAAFHDLGIADTDEDSGGKFTDAHPDTIDDDPMTTEFDDDWDQVRAPQGSLFIELYCPARLVKSPDTPAGDIYNNDGSLHVSRTNSEDQPVWRMAISANHPSGTSPMGRLATNIDSTTLDPEGLDPFNRSGSKLAIDRIVWFTDYKSGDGPAIDYNDDAVRYFINRSPGIYDPNAPGRPDPQSIPSISLIPGQYLVVGPRRVTPLGHTATGAPSSQEILLEPGSPAGGISVNGGQNDPPSDIQAKVVMTAMTDLEEGSENVDWQNRGIYHFGLNISEPLPGDSYYAAPTDLAASALDKNASDSRAYSTPKNSLISGQTLATRSETNVRTIFLQRLADPGSAWNANTNPYITVDFMPIDITYFNGDYSGANDLEADQYVDRTGAPEIKQGIKPPVQLDTRQRGNADYAIWTPAVETVNAPQTSPTDGSITGYFQSQFGETLGYLNNVDGMTPGTEGRPSTPFPWLVWNDKPFVSQYGLMQVPASSPARLPLEFGNSITTSVNDPYTHARRPFGHLLNFFHGNAELFSIFDYTHVPSHFPDAHTLLNETTFGLQANLNAANLNPSAEHDIGGDVAAKGSDTAGFHPPFNILSKYREPGRININTIASENVLSALLNGRSEPTWNDFINSRAGVGASYVSNPFRSAGSWNLKPTSTVINKAVDVTLLRPSYSDSSRPLFAVSPTAQTEAYKNAKRNSYFAYEGIQRLGNLVTTQSNVYAVWMTVGYFEVTPVTPSDTNPDGYQLGSELGIDTGEIKRHRAFYIIDRSIPVAFEPGQDHNVEKTIQLRRFIE